MNKASYCTTSLCVFPESLIKYIPLDQFFVSIVSSFERGKLNTKRPI